MRGQRFRLAEGGRVDRTAPVRFRFDGQAYEGCAGDTLASSLLANGVHLVGRSFKYHRPRGILSAGAEEPNALIQLGWRVLRFTVEDTGPGVAPEARERIFEAFFTTKADGMGIGLSVSRSIIESHHGRLWAAANDGPGATFFFSIPNA